MSIPLVSLPMDGPIATRPRVQSVYDTEAYNNAVDLVAKLTLFRNITAFQVASISLTKTAGRDTNLETPTALGKGDVLDWYGITLPILARDDLMTAANAVVFEEIARLRSLLWFTFNYGKTPYIGCQAEEIPAGAGTWDVQTTHDAMTVITPANTRNNRDAAYDITVNGYPDRITDRETFTVDLEATTTAPAVFSPTVELYPQCQLRGVLLRGIRG